MKQINLALIGMGGIGKTHLLAYQAMRLFAKPAFTPELRLIAKPSVPDYLPPGVRWITDDLAACTDPETDVVDITSPNRVHHRQVLAAAKAGKGIYCEKPLANTGQEAADMTQAVAINKVTAAVAFNFRMLPAVIAAREYLRQGHLGDIYNFHFAMLHGSYLDPNKPLTWRLQKSESGGGALMDLGIHIADLTRFLLGEVREVTGTTRIFHPQRPREDGSLGQSDVDEWALLELKLSTGANGRLETSRVSASEPEGLRIRIEGSRGKLELSVEDPWLPTIEDFFGRRRIRGGIELKSDFARWHKQVHPSQKQSMGLMLDSHYTALYNYLDSYSKGALQFEEIPSFADGLAAQRIIEAGYTSALTGRIVKMSEV